MKIKSKAQMFDLLQRDIFGNHFIYEPVRQWIQKTQIFPLKGRYSLRFGLQKGAPWKYRLSLLDVGYELSHLPEGLSLEDIMITVDPEETTIPILQGEFSILDTGPYLYCSKSPEVMRVALEQAPEHYSGLSAKLILEHFLDPSSYDDLMAVAYNYPDHMIEFGCYNQDVGVIPHRNTVIWEVRNY